MRLAGPLGTEFHQVVVALNEGNQTHQVEEFGPGAEHGGVETDGLDEQIDPLLGAKLLPGTGIGLQVQAGELDGLERVKPPGNVFRIARVGVDDVADAPDPTGQELGMVAHRLSTDLHPTDTQVGELGLIDIQLLIEGDGDLVNDAVAALLPDMRLDEAVITPVHVVLPEDASDLLDTGADGGVIVRGRVLA